MIISCEQCNKKFDVESSLIPTDGRLLQCSSCNHKWFYKKNIIEERKIKTEKKDLLIEKIKPKIKKTESIKVSTHKSTNQDNKDLKKNDKKIGILSIILAFIITFAALIILIDTFKNPLEIFIPNIDFILNSLYESLRDISLFLKDLF